MLSKIEQKNFSLIKPNQTTRLDLLLSEILADYSRENIKKWLHRGLIKVNGKTLKPSYIVTGKEQVSCELQIMEQLSWEAQAMDLDLVHVNKHYIIVNKPDNLVVHPGAGNHAGTLINGLIYKFPELLDLPRCGIVHRIDKDTSGLLLVARSIKYINYFIQQIMDKKVQREYIALVHGEMITGGTLSTNIGRDQKHRLKMSVHSQQAKPAITHYRISERFVGATKVAVKLETGRTHQIRVHMQQLGHPIIGDQLYGDRGKQPRFSRQALHAAKLAFHEPDTGNFVEYESKLPADLIELLQELETRS